MRSVEFKYLKYICYVLLLYFVYRIFIKWISKLNVYIYVWIKCNKKVKFIGVDYYKYNYFCDMFLLVCL